MRRGFEELVQVALTIELVLVAAGEIVPGADHLLPLGNSHLKQVAAAIVIAIAFHTFGKFFGGSRRSGAKPSGTDKGCVSAIEESRSSRVKLLDEAPSLASTVSPSGGTTTLSVGNGAEPDSNPNCESAVR